MAAIAVARARFAQAGNFANQPAPPISQNLNAAAFKDFATYVNQMAGAKVFTAAEQQVLGMRNDFIARLLSVDSVQFITPTEFQVSTYRRGGPDGPNDATQTPAVGQKLQFAFTHSTKDPAKLLVNHMVTPLSNPVRPAPDGEWTPLTLNPAKPNAPTVFYETAPLASRGDL